MQKRRIVVTGGAGFIGSSIVEKLYRDNEIIIIDDLSSGRLENLADFITFNNVLFVKGSILDINLLEKKFQGVDFVFHNAAIASVAQSIDDPVSTNEVNIRGTLNVLIAARNNKVKKVIFASSAAVYGEKLELPIKESSIPNLQSPYALSKLTGEYYCHIFNKLYELPTICLRYFNVFGPRQNINSEYSSVIPKFIFNVMNNNPPIIYGDGNQRRDFVFIKDIVQANLIAAETDENGVFNIGFGQSITINDLAEKIKKILGKNVKPIYKEPRTGDIKNSVSDITLANSLGYYPKYNLDDGLLYTINSILQSTEHI